MSTEAGENPGGFKEGKHFLFSIWTGSLHLAVTEIISPRLAVASLRCKLEDRFQYEQLETLALDLASSLKRSTSEGQQLQLRKYISPVNKLPQK
jgi:hypothetical protein